MNRERQQIDMYSRELGRLRESIDAGIQQIHARLLAIMREYAQLTDLRDRVNGQAKMNLGN